MATSRSGRVVTLATVALCSSLVIPPALADDDDENGQSEKTVKCDKSKASVQKAIDKVKRGKETIIFVEGFCDESVTIAKDGITLSGNKDGDHTVDGGLAEVRVVGAQRVGIEYLELTGSGYGVLAEEGASVTIRHSNIHDNTFDGVGAFNQVFVRVEFSTITGNGRPDPFFEAGIDASAGATVRSRGNLIADNGYAAVEIGNMAYFRSGAFTAGGPPDPGDMDIILQKGCSGGESAGECGDDGTVAIDCYRNGVCDLRNSAVTGQTFISGLSNFDVRTTTINGNVSANGGSRLHLRNSVTGSGFVGCSSEAFASSAIHCFGMIPP